MATFEHIDYALRPSKNIERKLIAEALAGLYPVFQISEYRYIGLGGIAFVDFVLFHRALRISDMISIQEGDREARRAAYNRPFQCISVHAGRTTDVLPALPLKDKPILMWLDYDSLLNGPILPDLQIACDYLKSGDIALFTLNADHRRQLVGQKAAGAVERGRKEVLGGLLDIPATRIPDEAVQAEGYPLFVAQALFDRLKSGARNASGGSMRFVPLFNIRYADGATMLTVGGMFANRETAQRLEGAAIRSRDSDTRELIYPQASGEDQFRLLVPLLTQREKLALDRLLPREEVPSEKLLAKAGCALDRDQVEAYNRFYRHYPTFAEMSA